MAVARHRSLRFVLLALCAWTLVGWASHVGAQTPRAPLPDGQPPFNPGLFAPSAAPFAFDIWRAFGIGWLAPSPYAFDDPLQRLGWIEVAPGLKVAWSPVTRVASRSKRPPRKAGPKPPRITKVLLDGMDEEHVRLRVLFSRKVPARVELPPDLPECSISLPGATFAISKRAWDPKRCLLVGMRAYDGFGGRVSRLVLRLTRPVSRRVVRLYPNGLVVDLGIPPQARSETRGLVVVVDPGHGGDASGCHWGEGKSCLLEKNLTLAIAERLQAVLREAHVTVLLTRSGDQSVDLPVRPAIANACAADMFLSIHIDDCRQPGSASGTTSYYHRGDERGRNLAEHLVRRLSAGSGLVDKGARSDGVLYENGLAVLRYSLVPAALVEVGYINNAGDRALLTNPERQQEIAQALFDGIAEYAEARHGTMIAIRGARFAPARKPAPRAKSARPAARRRMRGPI